MDSSDYQKLAQQFMGNAVQVAAGENIWIEYKGPEAGLLAAACAIEVSKAGANPYLIDSGSAALNGWLPNATDAELTAKGAQYLATMKQMQGYIRIDDDADQSQMIDAAVQLARYRKFVMSDATDHRVNHTRWLVTSAPTPAFAKACGMDVPAFEKFYKDVCLLDYGRMTAAAQPLEDLMRNAKDVHILGRDTDLRFSVAGINAVSCTGLRNIPDGECYTSPVRDSINGTILFGKSNYMGESFQSIRLTFNAGCVVKAEVETAERTAALNKILDTDAGGRYTGEFAIAFNPYVRDPVGDILFDEKIDGSLHIALGDAYKTADNGNVSDVHWDMVHIQRPEYGGGTIEFDGQIIRKDGRFVLPSLLPLNPENLKTLKP